MKCYVMKWSANYVTETKSFQFFIDIIVYVYCDCNCAVTLWPNSDVVYFSVNSLVFRLEVSIILSHVPFFKMMNT